MSKWKCEICEKEFDNFHAQGFDSKIYCPLCFFKEENKRLQQRINKAIEYIEELNKTIPRYWFTKLLEILKGE